MKIFLSVGSQLPMDRLVKAVDQLIAKNTLGLTIECKGQVGASNYEPKNIQAFSVLEEVKFREFAGEADVLISHAGMGNILLAEELNKPIIVLPRLLKFKEHVNDHQLGTVSGFANRHFIFALGSEHDIEEGLNWFKSWQPKKESFPEKQKLLNFLRDYILEQP